MKFRPVLILLLLTHIFLNSFAEDFSEIQGSDELVAGQYVKWAQKAIEEDRWQEALAALKRANDFADVSSDISYLLAVACAHEKHDRHSIIQNLDAAIETNRWVSYSENQALLLKAKQLNGMKRFSYALAVIEQIPESADSAMVRLTALKGLASTPDYVSELAKFRSLLLQAMDRYPRDPRPLRIFFEYARNKKPDASEPASELPWSDLNLLELAMRRLPFLVETDPELAWMAAPFMRDTQAAYRLMASYRAGGLSDEKKLSLSPYSIPASLYFGLINDKDAIEELFSSNFINKENLLETDALLGSEEGRSLLTQKLLSFSGCIYQGNDDGYEQSRCIYRSGVLTEFMFDENTDGIPKMIISFSADGVPDFAQYWQPPSLVKWERYPSVEKVTMADETFLFRPAGFQDMPVSFVELGGSINYSGLMYPVPVFKYAELTRRALISFCSSFIRPSREFKGAEEQIFLEWGVPWKAVETLNGKEVSVMEFKNGLPVVQYIDLDLDGRMETIRRFNNGLLVSSESDWTGDGKYKTSEVYQLDGSVVYSWDMDGSGVMVEINNE